MNKKIILIFVLGCVVGVCTTVIYFVCFKNTLNTKDETSHNKEFLEYEAYLKNGWGAEYESALLPQFVHVGQIVGFFDTSSTIRVIGEDAYIFAMLYPPFIVPDTVSWSGVLRLDKLKKTWEPFIRVYPTVGRPVFPVSLSINKYNHVILDLQVQDNYYAKEVFGVRLSTSCPIGDGFCSVSCKEESVDKAANISPVDMIKKDTVFIHPMSNDVVSECGYVWAEFESNKDVL